MLRVNMLSIQMAVIGAVAFSLMAATPAFAQSGEEIMQEANAVMG